MRKLVVTEWITLDGVFDADTMADWFFPYNHSDRQRSIRDTIMEADAFLLGHTTFEMLAPYWSSLQDSDQNGVAGALKHGTKYVAATKPLVGQWGEQRVLSGNLADEVIRLKQQDGKHILVMGSAALVRSLMPSGLIDEYRFLVHPVIAGQGKRFFSEDMDLVRLKLAETRMLDNAVVYQRYTAT